MITSPSNERIRYVRSLSEGKSRRRERAFVIEGVRLVEEALRAGVRPSFVLVDEEALGRSTRTRELLEQLEPFRPLLVSSQVLKAAAGTVTPQGVLAVVPEPRPTAIDPAGRMLLILDGLGDPGNVGTILRTAWASGIVRTIVGLGGADLYGSKVVRSAGGAHFHLQLLSAHDWAPLREQVGGRRLLAAVAAGGTAYYDVDWRGSLALIVGSEAQGIGSDIVAAADELVHIPMPGHAESLNAAVATGILVFEAVRQTLAG